MDSNSTGDWNRTNELLVQSEVQRPTTATPAFGLQLQQHSVRELNPICELQRLTSRLRAGESFPNQKSVLRESNPPSRIGSPRAPTGVDAGWSICRSAKDTINK